MKKMHLVLLALLFVPLIHMHAAMSAGAVLDLINAERRNIGIGPVTVNARLAEAAQMKAADMAAKGYFAHVGPDGKTPLSWLSAAGYEWSATGEILAFDSDLDNAQTIVTNWMNSPEHTHIITDSNYTETGIGITVGMYQGMQVVYVAEEFGKPKASVTIQAVAQTPAPVVSVTPPAVVTIPVTVPTASPVAATVATANVKMPTKPVLARSAPVKVVATAVSKAEATTTVAADAPVAPTAPLTAIRLSWFARVKNAIAGFFAYAFNF